MKNAKKNLVFHFGGGRQASFYRIDYVKEEKAFCFTYGDGVSNIDITYLIKFHNSHGKLATLTAVRPPSRFGALKINKNDTVEKFQEKPEGDGSWINGGYFVLSPEVVKFIDSDDTSWEHEPLSNIARKGELKAFRHDGYWQPMDTLREKNQLNELWDRNLAPWKVWK